MKVFLWMVLVFLCIGAGIAGTFLDHVNSFDRCDEITEGFSNGDEPACLTNKKKFVCLFVPSIVFGVLCAISSIMTIGHIDGKRALIVNK